mgnify:CR=1 FL=1
MQKIGLWVQGFRRIFYAKEAEEQKIIMKFDTESLVSGEYAVDLAVVEPRDAIQIRHDYLERALAFRVEKKRRHTGWHGAEETGEVFDSLS